MSPLVWSDAAVGVEARLLFAKVMHKRLFPRENAFSYAIYYMALPLSSLTALNDGWRFGVDRRALMSFYRRDHGPRDGSDLGEWLRGILHDRGLTDINGEIVLVCMPRIFGYVFNPVSFWLCYDQTKTLRAILYEVNNTFGESHCYLCAHADGRAIQSHDEMESAKMFHVSPFLEREGHYRFRFNISDESMGVWIDYFDGEGRRKLLTSLMGKFMPVNRANLRHAFWRYPLITFKAIGLIHWQAIRLLLKKAKYVPKPLQHPESLTKNSTITKI